MARARDLHRLAEREPRPHPAAQVVSSRIRWAGPVGSVALVPDGAGEINGEPMGHVLLNQCSPSSPTRVDG